MTPVSDIQTSFSEAKDLFSAGKLDEAAAICEVLLAQEPNRFEFLHLGGLIAYANRRFDLGESLLRQAISVKGGVSEASLNLARMLLKRQRYDEAEAIINDAIRLTSDWDQPYIVLGHIKDAVGQDDSALDAFEKAVQADPNKAENYEILGQFQSRYGQFERAESSLRQALQIQPNQPSLYLSLAQIHRFCTGDPLIPAMESLLPSLPPGTLSKSKLLFALGKAYDDIDETKKAFESFDSANHIAWELRSQNGLRKQLSAHEIIEAFNVAPAGEATDGSVEDINAIFVVGMPRSGSTLVESVFASNSAITTHGEHSYLARSIKEVFNPVDGLRYPKDIGSLSPAQLSLLREKYLFYLYGQRPISDVLVDKTLDNYQHIGLIRLLFPKAKIVNCQRDIRGIGLSLYQRFFPADYMSFSYNLDQIASQFRTYESLMAHWQNILPGLVHNVRYESLVDDFEQTIRSLMNFCDLPWEESYGQYWKTQRVVRTASLFQVRQPIYESSKEKWRKYEKYLGPLNALAESE